MFDKFLTLLSPKVEMPLGVDASNDFSAFASAFAVEVPYGLRTSTASPDDVDLSHALTFSVDDADPAARLHAVMKGRLRFVPAITTEPPRLELQPLPIHLLVLKRNSHLFPLFKQMLYSNVEPSSVQEAVTSLLTKRGFNAAQVAARLGEFMAGNRRLTVAAGDFIGRPAQDSNLGGRRRLDLMVTDRDGFYLNPAHFLFQWPTINSALENHPVLQVLEPTQDSMIFATKSRILYVSKKNKNPISPYDTKIGAAENIQDAVSVALPGDIVLVLDDETYTEKISMKNGVALTSLSGCKVIGRIELIVKFPTIECPDNDAAVTFKQLLIFTHISGFIIKHAANMLGSGILIDFCKRVEVAKNKIADNEARQGGGIAIINDCASVTIRQNVICQNKANDGVTGNNQRGQGGGIYVNNSRDIAIQDNVLFGNIAENFGGGIAIVHGKSIIVTKNDIGAGAPKYPAAAGNLVSKESPESAIEYSRNLNPQGGGGGIGITGGRTIIIDDNRIQHNSASRGGGIEIYSLTTDVRLSRNTIKTNQARKPFADVDFGGDGGGVAINYVTTNLAIAKLHSEVLLEDNLIEGNNAADDGGGVYGTGKAIIKIRGTDHKITNNSAQLNGGGVRATFGSSVVIEDGEVSGNKANQGTGTVKEKGGGGGVSFSNSSVSITRCTIKNNQVENFGGGGVYFATPRYPFDPFTVIGLSITDILEHDYEFTKGVISLDQCDIASNQALKDLGAGSGLYVVYDDYPIQLKMTDTKFVDNLANHTDPAKKHQVVIQSNSGDHDIVNDNSPELQSISPLIYDRTFTD